MECRHNDTNDNNTFFYSFFLQIELENLNTYTDEINKLEIELEVSNNFVKFFKKSLKLRSINDKNILITFV